MTVIRWLTFRRPLCHPAPSRWAVPTAAEEPQIFSPTHPSYLSTASECVIPRCVNTGGKGCRETQRLLFVQSLLIQPPPPPVSHHVLEWKEYSASWVDFFFFFFNPGMEYFVSLYFIFQIVWLYKNKKNQWHTFILFFSLCFSAVCQIWPVSCSPCSQTSPPFRPHTLCPTTTMPGEVRPHTHTLYLANAVQAWCFISWFRKCPEAQRPPDNNNVQWVLTLKDRPSRNDRARSLQSVLIHTRGVWWCRATLQLL